ncbi:hypothetical protein ACJRO7_004711 [Eucalyptus globulus]|uniref:Uncharacterized protein n=1 Tax=Eucalyptus globulus TaxID=34317 RepID=A0ABD3J2P4_EUCGL
MRVLKELDDMEARARHVLDVIEDVAASGGSNQIGVWLRVAVIGLEKATEAMSEGSYRPREGVNELFQTVTIIRMEMVDEFRVSKQKLPLPKKPTNPDKNN